MPRFFLGLLLTLGGAASLAAAEPTGPTPYPDPKNEAAWPGTGPIRVHNWMVDNRAYFWTQRAANQGAVVFVGDSLTGGWKAADLPRYFPGLRIANRGVGGDVSRGALFRLDEDVLALKPTAMVLCIGSNDLSCHAAPAGILANISAIVDRARQSNPTLPIVLCTIPPREAANAPTKPGALKDINDRITAFATGKPQLVLLDLHGLLAGPDGGITVENFAKDKLHLAGPGYEKWAAALNPILVKLLAPAAGR